MVQEQQGVSRLGGIWDQLVTSLPGNHSHLIEEVSIRAEWGDPRDGGTG